MFCTFSDLSDSEKGDICKDTEEETDQDMGKVPFINMCAVFILNQNLSKLK